MASGGAPATDPVALAQQVDAALREMASLQRALSRGRALRLLLVVFFLVVIGGVYGGLYLLWKKVTAETYVETVGIGVRDRLLGQNLDALSIFDESVSSDPRKQEGILTKEVRQFVRHSRPVLTNAFESQIKRDLPNFLKAAEKERDTFATELQMRLEKSLDSQYEKLNKELVDRFERVLTEQYPEAKDEKIRRKIEKNLDKVAERLVRKYYISQLETDLTTLYTLYDNFPTASAPDKDELPLENQLMSYLLELLKHWLSHPENVQKLTAQR
jgi:hypothetical protein